MAIQRYVRLFPLAVILAGVPACASSGIGSSGATAKARSSADVISRDEILSGHWQSAFELIQTLRPRWLRVHGPDTILGDTPDVQVHVDGNRLGGTSTLHGISPSDIMSIQFVDPVSAAARWGGDHANGAIIVSTRSSQ